MKYCSRCVTPYSRPNITFDANGQCNCATSSDKDQIDWDGREKLFDEVVAHAKTRSKSYDCLIPVSGGKDSTWQVLKCLEKGMRVLAVTWRPPGRTKLGQANLDNLVQLGCDHIDFTVNPEVEKKFTYLSYKKFGTTALPMHMALFNIPLTLAVRFSIPLVVWGENSAFEYGGTDDARKGFNLNSAWLKKYGVTHGTTAKDWLSDDLSEKDLAPYFGPSDEELEKAGVLAVFLGYYYRWDPTVTYQIAAAHGFQGRPEGPRTGYYQFADLDDDFIAIHHWLKWYKFGFTRTYDNLSLEIRNGRMTREEAIHILKNRGDETPSEDIEKFCAWLGITKEHFFEIAETFRNKEIWVKRDGKWIIPEFLIKDWVW